MITCSIDPSTPLTHTAKCIQFYPGTPVTHTAKCIQFDPGTPVMHSTKCIQFDPGTPVMHSTKCHISHPTVIHYLFNYTLSSVLLMVLLNISLWLLGFNSSTNHIFRFTIIVYLCTQHILLRGYVGASCFVLCAKNPSMALWQRMNLRTT